MNLPYVSPEQRAREHAEILAAIAKDREEKERQAKAEQEFDDFDFDFPFEVVRRPEENLKRSDFADKSINPFMKYNSSHYQINITHPAIAPIFEQYVRSECSVPPISDHERIMFEMRVIHQLDRIGVFKEDYDRQLTDEEIRKMKYKAIRDRERDW
ncbi:MAG: hypothetical protein IJK26_09060 [Clostridia bacterium]|nr:hypothetical protein [Clostridia bacterium]